MPVELVLDALRIALPLLGLRENDETTSARDAPRHAARNKRENAHLFLLVHVARNLRAKRLVRERAALALGLRRVTRG